ncbi:MAG: chromosome segregation protein SMC [Lentisphaerae bacterium]|nr:chromosome segregation protein SMC [Lentisphaerota bacterium]
MYLKSLQMTGFKSFADKTRLDFEPGMTAIVGPNGCGKSNISDAIRWVLGETSAKALRGSKMEDCIFGGTDDRKPLGMAQVDITFTDCEDVLNTDYHEVTVSRRVFRSGEGAYFLNKTPCRLKDIQRLFMDTGIGTSSYSLMEQGRIDQILSSRPEDRRQIFEEASGITKFKADKKEAIRKLEHTEANLLRLADVIREVKRQIGSLQRQAGKARRYQSIKQSLRTLDLFLARRTLAAADAELQAIESELAELNTQTGRTRQEVDEIEKASAALRTAMMETEREIASVLEAGVQAQSTLDHTRELIGLNRQRIEEYEVLSQRDSREITDTHRQMETQRRQQAELEQRLADARQTRAGAETEMRTASEALETHQSEVNTVRDRIRTLREESVEMESLASRLQNEMIELESRERSTVIRRERLAAEKSQLARVLEARETRLADVQQALERRRAEAAARAEALPPLRRHLEERRAALAETRARAGDLQARSAALEARLQVLEEKAEAGAGIPAGTRLLLDPGNPLGIETGSLLGPLASHIETDAALRTALETVLRAWLDGVLVADGATARRILSLWRSREEGPGRLLNAAVPPEAPPEPPAPGCRPFLDGVRCSDVAAPVVRRLLAHVWLVDSLESIPDTLPAHVCCVTPDGCLVHGAHGFEYGTRDTGGETPLARKHLRTDAEDALAAVRTELESASRRAGALSAEIDTLEAGLETARVELEAHTRKAAQTEGEHEVVSRETEEARRRLETVAWECDNLGNQDEADGETRETIVQRSEALRARREQAARDISERTRTLHDLENRQTALQSAATEARIRLAQEDQTLEHLETQRNAAATRLAELQSAVDGRTAGIQSYEARIAGLRKEIEQAEAGLASLETAVGRHKARSESLRRNREKQASELSAFEAQLADTRNRLETVHNRKSETEVHYMECRMRRQNLLDRAASEYQAAPEDIMAAPEPEWENDEAPSAEALETQIAELRTRLEAMGPVNLVAIEEHRELEERYRFLTGQEEDLARAKQQLMDMIRKINRTTSDMFRNAFQAVNDNFQSMFKQLFNGGSAKLVLVDEEDVLECGIEIIARPPGKRLQNISLLSGGERTLTAVSLLFAIYMLKPSPFCLLDELDAALDESNIGRFVNVLKAFLRQSQFVVITHNRQTIAAAETLYGVTMPGKGISRIISMRFNPQSREAVAS